MSKNNYDINFIELARITSDRFQYWSFVLLTFGEKGEISPQVIEKILSCPTSQNAAAIFDFNGTSNRYTQIDDFLTGPCVQWVCVSVL